MTYTEQIKHPKWQKKRLEILERDNFECKNCKDKNNQLHVHHLIYKKNKLIWEYNNKELITLCNECHDYWHRFMDEIKETLSIRYSFEDLIAINNLLKGVEMFEAKDIFLVCNYIESEIKKL